MPSGAAAMTDDRLLPRDVGRYRLYDEVASGGMATVHVGRLRGPAGFARTVAIKRLHPQFAHDPEFVSMFLDEARLAARIHHPNVAAILDVVALRGELFLVMEYVRGETLSRLLPACERAGITIPHRIAATILQQALLGLHAAHEARDHRGDALNMVHRDVSPQNIMVGADGITRMLDFGVAKAATRIQTTGHGQVKGKLSYMAPEQLRLEPIDRRTDIFAAGVVLWEALTGKRLFASDDPGAVIARILTHVPEPPSRIAKDIPPELDRVVANALKRQRSDRFATALEFAKALEQAVTPVGSLEVSDWVCAVAGPVLEARERTVAAVEIASESTPGEPIRSDEITSAPPPIYSRDANDELTLGVIPEAIVEPERSKRRSFAWAALGLSLLLLLVWIIRTATVSDPSVAASAQGSPEQSEQVSLPSPTEPTSEALPDQAVPEVPTVASSPPTEPLSSSESAETPVPSARTAVEAPPRRAASAKGRAAAPSVGNGRALTSGCDPPYDITPQGFKRFKPACFR